MRISVHDSHFGCEEYHLGNSGRLPNGGADDIVEADRVRLDCHSKLPQ